MEIEFFFHKVETQNIKSMKIRTQTQNFAKVVFLIILLVVLKVQIGNSQSFYKVMNKQTCNDAIEIKPLKTDQFLSCGWRQFTDLNFLFFNDSFDAFNISKDFVKPLKKLGLQANFR